MNAMFGWVNRVKTSNLIYSTAATGMDPSQLQNDQGTSATAWQTTLPSGQYLVLDAGRDVTWRAFGVFRTNFSPTARLRWYLVTDDMKATSLDSGFSPAMLAGALPGFGQSLYVTPTDVVGRYLHLDLFDPDNPDGFINIPLLFAGPVWSPQTNISYDTVLGRDDMTDETVTRGGQEFPTMRFSRRRWDVALSGIRQAELWPKAMELDAYGRTGGNALFIPDPAGDMSREAVFGRAKSIADVSFPYGCADRRAWKVRFTERL